MIQTSGYDGGRGYLAACTLGVPTRATRAAVQRDLDDWSLARATAGDYAAALENARTHAGHLLGRASTDIATGSQVSVFTGLAAAAAPTGVEILVPHGDFSSVVAPFLTRPDLRVRHVPLHALADEITDRTWMVSYSLVQSATGDVADSAAICEAARTHDALTLVDTTQATGWMPTTDLDADLVVCHAYKWLAAPRGAAFAAASARAIAELTPLTAGWYSGDDPWASCYGPDLFLSRTARRFDVSPAWHAWVGAEVALREAAALDMHKVRDHDVALANAFRAELDLAPSNSAIVTWADPEGCDLARLTSAGLTASGRAGRARVSFHLWNDERDVELALGALGRAPAQLSYSI